MPTRPHHLIFFASMEALSQMAGRALVAALIARLNGQSATNKTVGYITPTLYQAGPDGRPMGLSVCADVVSGNNSTAKAGGYSAGQGYDAASGWGTPDGVKLAMALGALG
jgi:kumamolisin